MPRCVSSSVVWTGKPLPMPDYDELVNRARLTSSGEIDRSMIDFSWAATVLGRGHSSAEVMVELDRVSLKAKSLSGSARRDYVSRTVRAAVRSR